MYIFVQLRFINDIGIKNLNLKEMKVGKRKVKYKKYKQMECFCKK